MPLARPTKRLRYSVESCWVSCRRRVLIINLDDFGMYHAINAAVVSSIKGSPVIA